MAQDVTENQNPSTLLLLLELDVKLDGTLVVILQHMSCGWRGKTSGSCSLVSRPSHPALVLQATNTGARRPGYEATSFPGPKQKILQSLGAHKELDIPTSFGLGTRVWQLGSYSEDGECIVQ